MSSIELTGEDAFGTCDCVRQSRTPEQLAKWSIICEVPYARRYKHQHRIRYALGMRTVCVCMHTYGYRTKTETDSRAGAPACYQHRSTKLTSEARWLAYRPFRFSAGCPGQSYAPSREKTSRVLSPLVYLPSGFSLLPFFLFPPVSPLSGIPPIPFSHDVHRFHCIFLSRLIYQLRLTSRHHAFLCRVDRFCLGR